MATICIAESTLCTPNLLTVVGGKLLAQPAVAVFRADRPAETLATTGVGAHTGVFESPIPFSDVVEDTTPGIFELTVGGGVQVNCTGIYSVKVKYGSGGSTATNQTGGFLRWTRGAETMMGFDFDDLTSSIDLGSSDEGPEFECFCAGVELDAGEVIEVDGRMYGTTGFATIVGGQIQCMYHGVAL
jgi:hypothetical protein